MKVRDFDVTVLKSLKKAELLKYIIAIHCAIFSVFTRVES